MLGLILLAPTQIIVRMIPILPILILIAALPKLVVFVWDIFLFVAVVSLTLFILGLEGLGGL